MPVVPLISCEPVVLRLVPVAAPMSGVTRAGEVNVPPVTVGVVIAGEPFVLIGFSGPGLTWQIFQGLTLYALVAATTYAFAGSGRGR